MFSFYYHFFNDILLSFFFPAIGKVLASELPKCGNRTCTVLYPASVKAGNEIGMCITSVSKVLMLHCFCPVTYSFECNIIFFFFLNSCCLSF